MDPDWEETRMKDGVAGLDLQKGTKLTKKESFVLFVNFYGKHLASISGSISAFQFLAFQRFRI